MEAFFRRRVIRDELESSEKREQLCVQDYENRCVPCPVRITVLVLSRLSAISFYSMLLVSATARHLTTGLDIGSRIAANLRGRPLPSYDNTAVLDNLRADMEYRGRRAAIKHEDGVFWDSGKMSYHCPICNAGYTYKKTLKTHMKYDCGKEPRFKCPYCNKRDKCSSNIYKHIRMRHDGMPVIVHRN
ncbi:uncharacterized protein LOC117207796 [Bombus bifarius]|uniref:Uncharacterized protein LOC117207796 n=1 Tax=Bombus bifarius TaxID=103933 RepID=A0A6P8M0P0_9HYME|nr:uncharacterized protein LOC117207796 [Bombus bifarius]